MSAIPDGGERPLDDYDMLDPALLEAPWGYYRALRREAPVHRDPRTGLVQVSTHELVLRALRQPDVFSNRFGAALAGRANAPDGVREVAKRGWPPVDTMLTADPPAHTRFRGLVNKAFTPRRVTKLEPRIREVATALIDAFAPRGRVELLSEFSVPLPLTIIADQLGVPREDLPRFKRWSDGFVAQLSQLASPEARVEAAELIVEFQHYFARTLEARRAEPRDDILSDLVHARLEGERPLDTAESLSILQQLLVAGNETTASAIAEGIWLLVRHPDQLALVREAPEERIPGLVEEVLRLATPTQNMFRVVTRDTELGGVALPKGQVVLLRFAAANRDGGVFPDPDRFDVTRPNAGDHLAFGHGIHFCVGAALARREMRVAFELLLGRLHAIRLAPGRPVAHKPNALLRGLRELHLEFEPR